MKIAIDTCVGKKGRALLESSGHTVVVEADQGEMDHVWFSRALQAGVELVVSSDSDLDVLCYDHRISFFLAKQKHTGFLTAQRVLMRYPGADGASEADTDLRERARKQYGVSCSQVFCKAGGGLSGSERMIELPTDMKAERDPNGDGTWITVRVLVFDEDLDECADCSGSTAPGTPDPHVCP